MSPSLYDLLKDLKITSRLGYTYVNLTSKGFNPYQFYGVGHNATNANARKTLNSLREL